MTGSVMDSRLAGVGHTDLALAVNRIAVGTFFMLSPKNNPWRQYWDPNPLAPRS